MRSTPAKRTRKRKLCVVEAVPASESSIHSPAPGDPRFSRATPANVLAKVKANNCANESRDRTVVWASRCLEGRARKTPIYDPSRNEMLEKMLTLGCVEETLEDMRGKIEPSSTQLLIDGASASAYSP